MSVYQSLLNHKQNKLKNLAVLIDPDQHDDELHSLFLQSKQNDISLFLVGGSLVSKGITKDCVRDLKSWGAENVILFPGNEIQLCENADALLFMSLISGRNSEYLIGKQVTAAPWIKKSGIESLPTGYMLVESGKLTSANYISGTLPIPNDKPDIAAATAIAGELLGMNNLYLDAGSGAKQPVPAQIIKSVNKNTDSILWVGGGIRSAKEAKTAWTNGADIVVVGNGLFEIPDLIEEISAEMQILNQLII